MPRAKKTDTIQKDVVDALRKIGCAVEVTSGFGQGFPDLLVGLAGRLKMLEVKSRDGELTESQITFHHKWFGYVWTVRSAEKAIEVMTQD